MNTVVSAGTGEVVTGVAEIAVEIAVVIVPGL